MLAGQVGLCLDGDTFWSRSIERITQSRAHHVVVAYSETMCISAQPGGARLRPVTDFQNAVWSRFELTDYQRQEIRSMAYQYRNTPYNYAGFALIGAEFHLRRQIPGWLARAVSRTQRMECAQLADLMLSAAGVSVFNDGREPGMIYPGSWERKFLENGWIPPRQAAEVIAAAVA